MNISEFWHFAGKRFWTASLLPTLIGTTLPFWLNPPHFEFNLVKAIVFFLVIFFGHIGFSFFHSGFMQKQESKPIAKRLFIYGIIGLSIAILLGIYLNTTLQFHPDVPGYIFILYVILTIFVGVLYTFPPFSFHQRLYGEVVLSVGLGLLPIIGAYLVQVGDITRTVYLASMPVALSTGLWIWIIELINLQPDKKKGYKTTPMFFNEKFSGRYLTSLLILLIYLSLVGAVIGRSSLNPLSLGALISLVFAFKIIQIVWNNYQQEKALKNAERYAYLIHLSVCLVIILASLTSGL